jgi:hypothetical protein
MRLTATKPDSKPRNVFQRVWQWLKTIPSKIAAFFKSIFNNSANNKARTEETMAAVAAKKPLPFSHIDPKLIADHYKRHRIGTTLAEETFDDAVRYYQNKTVEKDASGIYQSWNGLIGQRLSEKAQKLLNTNTQAGVIFLEDQGLDLGSYPPYKHVINPV